MKLTQSLTVTFIGVAITVPVIIAYTIFMYKVFWGKARSLTPRERARLQGFPETFKPHPVKTHANKQFGNSIAVPVAAAIGHAINQQFFKQAA